MNNRMDRTIAVSGLVVAILAILVQVATPEIRCWIRIEKISCSQQVSSNISPVSPQPLSQTKPLRTNQPSEVNPINQQKKQSIWDKINSLPSSLKVALGLITIVWSIIYLVGRQERVKSLQGKD